MAKKTMSWLEGMHKKDTPYPTASVKGQLVYTIYMEDFLKMPDVNYPELSKIDAGIRVLFN